MGRLRATCLGVVAVALSMLAARPAAAQHSDSLTTALLRAANAPVLPGDRIVLRVWHEPTLTDTFTVNHNSEVVLPKIGRFSLVGRTIGSVTDTITVRLAEFLNNPAISVTVLRRVGVQGEVRSPGLYVVDVTMTLREIIAVAGGITEAGNLSDVAIFRGDHRIPVGGWERGGPSATVVQSGDQIVVGRRSWLSRNTLPVFSTAAVALSLIVSIVKK